MMDRQDRLAENSLVNRIKALRQGIDDLKATSQAMGSTAVRLQRVLSGNPVDFSVAVAYHVIHGWEITFTPDSSPFQNAGILWALFFELTNIVGSAGYAISTDFVSVTEDNVWTYRFWIMGTQSGASMTFDVYLIAYAMTRGSFSVSQIQ